MKHFFTIREDKTLELAHVGTEESLVAEFTAQHEKVILLTEETIEKCSNELDNLNPKLEVSTVEEIEELAKYVHFHKQKKLNEISLEELKETVISIDDLPVFVVENVGKDLTIDNFE